MAGGINLFVGENFGVNVTVSGDEITGVTYQPDLKKADVEFKSTRAGSETLRWIMLQVAQVAARHSPAARAYQQRLRRKKRPQVAKVALARKLLVCVWALLRHGVCYDDATFALR